MIELIDISEHNVRRGVINWRQVKAAGITGVMIRVGWAGYKGPIAANNGLDPSLDASIRGAYAAGLNVGLYVYTYTETPEAARIAAAECVSIAKRYPGIINLPLAFDVEETALPCLTKQGKSGLTDTVIAFITETQSRGYYAVWYTYTAFAVQYLDRSRLSAYDLWIADYRGSETLMQGQLGRQDYGMWQYIGDAGRCVGVTGPCDRNYCYKDYPALIAEKGLNGLSLESVSYYKAMYQAEHEARLLLQTQCDTLKNKLTQIAKILA